MSILNMTFIPIQTDGCHGIPILPFSISKQTNLVGGLDTATTVTCLLERACFLTCARWFWCHVEPFSPLGHYYSTGSVPMLESFSMGDVLLVGSEELISPCPLML